MQYFPNLFSPIQVGSMKVKNRVFMSAMATGLCDNENKVTDEVIAYYAARAKGGVGLITTEAVMPDEFCHYGIPNNMGLYSDEQISGMKKLADVIHQYGAKLVPQLLHAGTAATALFNNGRQCRSASAITLRALGEIPLPMPKEEIWEFTRRMAEAAGRAREAGCDGVEIHSCHRHGILGSFLSPLSNKRTDEYGGSIEGRMRFLLEVITAVRKETGRDFPIIVRLSMTEYEPGGQSLLDAIYIGKKLEAEGVDMLNLSDGTIETYWRTVTPNGTPRGVNTDLSQRMKAALNIPVGVNGRNCEPWSADLVISLNRVDVTYMARSLLCDPEFPNKAMAGRQDEIRPCIGCTDCITHRYGYRTYCSMNPYTGRETFELKPAPKGRKVLVAGGGPAGLQAATTAAERGFEVTLIEKNEQLGGQMYIAGFPLGKHDIVIGTKFLIENTKRAGVSIITGEQVTAGKIRELKPDIVIVATGGEPVVPKFLSGANQLVNAWDALTGKVYTGQNIVVIGGGAVGCETAEFLVHPQNDQHPKGKKVTIIEMLDNLMMDDPAYNRSLLIQRLHEKGVNIFVGAKVESVEGDKLVYTKDGQSHTLTGIDTAISAVGTRPINKLPDELEGSGIRVYSAGDSLRVGRLYDALKSGAEVAEAI